MPLTLIAHLKHAKNSEKINIITYLFLSICTYIYACMYVCMYV